MHNNSSVTVARVNTTQACAACKYQRRRCPPDCILAPYFPHDRQRHFLNAHKLFGVSNITKIIRNLDQPEKDAAMRTIIFQSDVRAADPVGGCYRIVRQLHRQIDYAKAELDIVLHQLALCRAQAAHQQLLMQEEAINNPDINCDIFGVDSHDPQALINNYQQYDHHHHHNNSNNTNNIERTEQFVVQNGNNASVVQEACDSWGMQGSSVSPCVQIPKQPSVSGTYDFKPFVVFPGDEDPHEFRFESEETIEQRDGAYSDEATRKEEQATLKQEEESFHCSRDHELKSAAVATLFPLTKCTTAIPVEGSHEHNC